MRPDSLPAVRDRIRAAWASRRSCGIVASAAGLRVERIIALAERGCLPGDLALRMALEAEALALPFPPLPCSGGVDD